MLKNPVFSVTLHLAVLQYCRFLAVTVLLIQYSPFHTLHRFWVDTLLQFYFTSEILVLYLDLGGRVSGKRMISCLISCGNFSWLAIAGRWYHLTRRILD